MKEKQLFGCIQTGKDWVMIALNSVLKHTPNCFKQKEKKNG